MEHDIRHRRLHAFYKSKVLNALMIVVFTCLLLMAYAKSMLIPVMCGSLAMTLFIGYSIWLWIKKPESITINNLLSNINGLFTFYFLVIVLLDTQNRWWYLTPVACAVLVLFVSLVNYRDEKYDI